MVWIDEHSKARSVWQQLVQERKPLRPELHANVVDSGRIAARSIETGNEADLHRVRADDENDGNCRRCRFCGECRRSAYRRHDHSHTSLDQIGSQCRKGLIASFGPTIVDRRILAVDVSGFVQSFVKRRDVLRECCGRRAVEKSDNRHRLLSMCNHRPKRGTTGKPHKLTASHLTPRLRTRRRPLKLAYWEGLGARAPMSALGQKQTVSVHQPISALPPKADIPLLIRSLPLPEQALPTELPRLAPSRS